MPIGGCKTNSATYAYVQKRSENTGQNHCAHLYILYIYLLYYIILLSAHILHVNLLQEIKYYASTNKNAYVSTQINQSLFTLPRFVCFYALCCCLFSFVALFVFSDKLSFSRRRLFFQIACIILSLSLSLSPVTLIKCFLKSLVQNQRVLVSLPVSFHNPHSIRTCVCVLERSSV